jgi:hypothetical protein
MTELAAHAKSVPRDALCLKCNYALRGLISTRCPECGAEFDPSNPWTMNLGRPMPRWARRAISNVGTPTRRLTHLALTMIVWGLMWLPGAYIVAFFGLLVLLALYIYRAIRLIVRSVVRGHYRQPVTTPGPTMRLNLWLAIVMCILSIFHAVSLGPWLTLQLTRVFFGTTASSNVRDRPGARG